MSHGQNGQRSRPNLPSAEVRPRLSPPCSWEFATSTHCTVGCGRCPVGGLWGSCSVTCAALWWPCIVYAARERVLIGNRRPPSCVHADDSPAYRLPRARDRRRVSRCLSDFDSFGAGLRCSCGHGSVSKRAPTCSLATVACVPGFLSVRTEALSSACVPVPVGVSMDGPRKKANDKCAIENPLATSVAQSRGGWLHLSLGRPQVTIARSEHWG